MLKKPTKKLSIQTETIRKLADAELTRVAGGAISDDCTAHCTMTCGPSAVCSRHLTGCCTI